MDMRLNAWTTLLSLTVFAAGATLASAADLLAPGQPIIGVAAAPGSAASAIAVVGTAAGANNYPAAETPAMAIDGSTSSKYLNFAEINTGFIVTIPGGLTTVTGFQFTAANDAPERDPITVSIEGTSAADPTTAATNATWTSIYSGQSGLAADPGRFGPGAAMAFANAFKFNTYRVLITSVRTGASANSMQFSEVQFFGTATDITGPTIASESPERGTSVRELLSVEVVFNEPVEGVDASDLLVNGTPATGITFGDPGQFLFSFPQPPTGTVTIAFAPGHGIQDLATNAFAGDSWTYTLDPNAAFTDVRINEFLADNESGIRDEDSSREDWIELYNPGPTAVNMAGWFLTDSTANLTKWRFPAGVQMGPNTYLLIWASGKNRTNIGALHSNFQLSRDPGEYLALVGPATNVVSSFGTAYPAQRADVSYGRDRLDPNIVGFYDVPTPNAANATSGRIGFAPDVTYSVASTPFVTPFSLTLSTPSTNAVIRYVLITNSSQGTASLTNVPTTNSPIYTGPIQIDRTTIVRARAFEPNLFPGTPGVGNYIQVNNDVRNFTSDLPVCIVHSLGGTIATPGGDTTGLFMGFDSETGRTTLSDAPQVATRMGFHIRGSSTAGQAKSNYRIEFRDEFNADEDHELFGMPADSDWVLHGINGFDPGLMHNALYQWLGAQVGVPYMRTRYVEVFRKVDGGPITTNDYFGLYLLLETPKVGNDRLDIASLHDQDTNTTAITGGYLMKIDRIDNERSFTPPTIGSIRPTPTGIGFVDPPFKSSPAETDPRRIAQINYMQNYILRFITNLSSVGYTNPVTGYAQYINPEQWINHLWANIIPFNVDGYRLSGFFYKDRNGRLEQGPMWDCDRCLGTGGSSGVPQGDNRCFSPRFWRLPVSSGDPDNGTDFFGVSTIGVSWFTPLFRDPDFWQLFIDRYQMFRTNEYSTATIAGKVDAIHAEIKEAQVREQARWAPSGFNFPRSGVQTVNGYSFNFGPADNFGRGRYSNEVAFQKQWLIDRLTFFDTNFLNAPTLSSGTALVPSGTMVTAAPAAKANSRLLYTLDGTDPRMPGGGVSPSALMSMGPLTLTVTQNVRLFARSWNPSHANQTNGGGSILGYPLLNSFWSGPVAATYFTAVPTLRITELMYHPSDPPAGNTNDADNFEYVELKNIGATTLNLAGFNLGGGIDFIFTNFTLAAGEYCVVVKDSAAFQSRYPSATSRIAGVFQGNLANDGDHVVLRGPLQEPIQDFVYSATWYPLTLEHGFSLVVLDETGGGNLSTNTGWRYSSVDGGSPGASNPPPSVIGGVVLVNEALTHTDPPPPTDTIELYNPGTSPVNISGWWLTDDFTTPKKYQIAAGTTIPAGGYLLFNESQFNAAADPNGFALGSDGDEVFLFSGTNGFITGYHHGFEFGPAQNGRTFGRYVDSQGAEHFVAQVANSLGATNGLPLVGPIVITEIMYHPPEFGSGTNLVDNSIDEFIELHNISSTNVPLYHALYPSNTWRLTSAVDFSFPANVTLPPGGYALVVSFDPAVGGPAFRAKYNVSPSVPLFGPYEGKLDNSADSVRLRRPDNPNGPDVPYIIVDQIDYRDVTPWPFTADGLGASLQRLVASSFGNDPTNWAGARTSAGGAIEGGAAPVITLQPINITVVEGNTTNLSVVASSPTAMAFQWQQNSNPVPGATSATLVFSNILPGQAGVYTVGIFNGAGSAFSAPVTVTVLPLPVVTLAPQSQNVATNSTFNLSVGATGTGPLSYQWRFTAPGSSPVNIPGATSTNLSISNAELFAHAGYYDVAITDNIGTRISPAATIVVLTRPYFITQPVAQTVLQGQTARFTVEAAPVHPLLPLAYRWIRNGVGILTNTVPVLTLSNVQIGSPNPVPIRCAITNITTGAGGVNSTTVQLLVLADFDGDGMADSWETQYGFNTNNVADGALDLDNDQMINRDEYAAGTNPNDPTSLLKLQTVATNASLLQFVAQSNFAYTVQYRTNFTSASWSTLTNISAEPGVRTVDVNNLLVPLPDERYYRVVTPQPGPF